MNNLPRHPEGLVIVAGDKTVELMAETAIEKLEWMTAIKRALSQLSGTATSSGSSTAADSPSTYTFTGPSSSASLDSPLRPLTPETWDKHESLREPGQRERRLSSRKHSNLEVGSDPELARVQSDSPLANDFKRNSTALPELGEGDGLLFSDENSEDELFPEENMSSQVRPGSPAAFSDDDDPWTSPTKERQFLSDWALVEEWVQDLTTNMKMNNEVVKTEVKKALGRLKRDSAKPFVSLGNDIKKLNDLLVGKQKPKKTEDGSQEKGGSSSTNPPQKDTEENGEASSSSAAKEENIPASEVQCGCADHYENTVLDTVINGNVDTIFKMLYASHSPFYTAYNAKRGVKDFEEDVTELETATNLGVHWKKRALRYNLYFKNPLCMQPPFSPH